MKRIISILLMIVIAASNIPVSAAETGIEYFTIPVEYSDHKGHIEYLDIMIKDNNVYADAKMLAERLGYTCGEQDGKVAFMNSDASNGLPTGFTIFSLSDTKVEHMFLYSISTSYEAPFPSIKNDKGIWVPFEYALLLSSSGMMITDEALLIDIPTKRIIDYYRDVMKSSGKYLFTWEDDFGYTAGDVDVLGKCGHMVNLFSGLLNFEGASWVSLFQQFAGSYESYDRKYGEDFATLLCTESDKELAETIDKVELLVDALDEDGQLGSALSSISGMKESQIDKLYGLCEEAFEHFKSGNSPLVTYNRTYQALKKTLDEQTWFSHTGENILEVQKGLSSGTGKAFKVLNIASKVLKVCGYAQEFQNQDTFTVAALTAYLAKEKDGAERLELMKKSMLDYSKSLSTNIGQYTLQQFQNHIDEWIESGVDISSKLGNQANIALFAWNLAANIIPFISNGLSGADNFELALYAGLFQDNIFLNYQDKRDSVFSDDSNITAENLYELTQYCYLFLKSCYVTREAALASLANKRESVKEKIQPLIDEQNDINKEIARILVEFKGANTTNEGGVYGFLPSDNQEYLRNRDDNYLISWARMKDKNLMEREGDSQDIGSDESGDSSWKQSFINCIETDSEIAFNPDWCTCGLIYIDDDDIPELIIEYSSEADGTKIVSFKNGEMTSYRFSRTGGIHYIERGGVVYNSIGHAGQMHDELATLDKEGFHDLGRGIRYDETQAYSDYTYFNWNGEEVSKDEYNKHISVFDNTQFISWNSYSEELKGNNYKPNEMCEYLRSN